MKKYLIWTLSFVLVISLLAGCQKQVTPTETPTPPPAAGQPTPEPSEVPNDVILDSGDLEDSTLLVKQAYEALSKTKGYIWFEGEGTSEILVLMGEKPTGGFHLEGISAEMDGDVLRIVVREVVPGANESVTQALTYPYLYLSLDRMQESVTVENTEGEAYTNLVLPGITAATGVYTGQIDNNSIEVNVDAGFDFVGSGTFVAFRLDVLTRAYFDSESPHYKDFKDGTAVNILFYLNENGQYVLADMFPKE
ncbi:MAG: protease complex subunit PrcB family protein [Clostridia bacterium]